MVDTLDGYPHENQSPELRKLLYTLMLSLEGRTYLSPRNKILVKKSKPYTFKHIYNKAKALVIIQSDKRPLHLPYWRFLHVVDMLENSGGNPIHVESSSNPKRDDTIEGNLMKRAREAPYSHHRLRTAVYICDVLEIGGFCEYVSMINPHTGRTVVGIQEKVRTRNS